MNVVAVFALVISLYCRALADESLLQEPQSSPVAPAVTVLDNKPSITPDGLTTFAYGGPLPTVLCAPLQICDIELQAGETIRAISMGDTARWEAMPLTSGPERAETPHVAIKAKVIEPGMATTLLVTTDRRTYHLSLRLSEETFMPRVHFTYSDASDASLLAYRLRAQSINRTKSTPVQQKRPSEKLDFNYSVKGRAEWKPLRVYNDGKKTFIDLPDKNDYEFPVLFVVDAQGTQELVNYRLDGKRFKVDAVISNAVLVSGVGDEQQRIAISRKGE